MPVKVQGWDLSLNHAAFVEVVDGELGRVWYVTNTKESFLKMPPSSSKGKSFLIPSREKSMDLETYGIVRLEWWLNFFAEHVKNTKPQYVGIEGYAMNAAQGSHQIGEVGGLARLACWQQGDIKIRIHDPLSVKMFAAHDGSVKKIEVEKAVLSRWGVDFSCYNPKAKITKKFPEGKVNRETSEDLSDAFSIAQFLWTEILLRQGKKVMSELHEKEIQAFNRATVAHPANVLGREWILNQKKS